MANPAIKVFNWWRRYRVRAVDMTALQNGIFDSMNAIAEGTHGGAILQGYETTVDGGMGVTIQPGIAVAPTGNQLVSDVVLSATVEAPDTFPSRSLVVLRPTITDADFITKPTDAFNIVPLTGIRGVEAILIPGTPSQTPFYPAKQVGDVIVCGIRAVPSQSVLTAADLDFEIRDYVGKNSNLFKTGITSDPRVKPYQFSATRLGIKPSQIRGSMPVQFYFPGKNTPSLYPKDGSSEFVDQDSFYDFSDGSITGGDDQSSAFTPVVASGSNAIVATVVLNQNDNISVNYGTAGTVAQCLNAIKNQIDTGPGGIALQDTAFKIAYVLVRSFGGSVSDIQVYDARGLGLAGSSSGGVGVLEESLEQFNSNIVAGEALTAFEAISLQVVSGEYKYLKSLSTDVDRYGFAGFAQTNAGSGAAVKLQTYGPLQGFSGLDIGSDYYVSDTTPGAISTVIPTNPIYVGKAIAADTLFVFCPNGTVQWGDADLNYWGDESDGAFDSAGSDVDFASTTDGPVVVKNFTSFQIDATDLVTVLNRCKGLVIYCTGNAVIDGELSMTGKGANADPTTLNAIAATGIRLARFKTGETDTLAGSDVGGVGADGVGAAWIAAEAQQDGISGNGKIYVIEREGGAGAVYPGLTGTQGGLPGGTVTNGTGGGGTGSVFQTVSGASEAGDGAEGNCYAGGPGGGSAAASGTNLSATDGLVPNVGGDGAGNNASFGAGAGAGAISGVGAQGGNVGEFAAGLLIMFVKGTLTINGTVSSNGGNGGSGNSAGGGGGGGGFVLLLAGGGVTNSGTVEANGGLQGTASPNGVSTGGDGGAGTVIMETIDL